MRKTIRVEKVKQIANEILLHTPDTYAIGRDCIGVLLNRVLSETGNYRGFRYLTERDMRKSEQGTIGGITSEKITDDTRRHYF